MKLAIYITLASSTFLLFIQLLPCGISSMVGATFSGETLGATPLSYPLEICGMVGASLLMYRELTFPTCSKEECSRCLKFT